jgi:predicted RNA-binding protein with PUA-like domain
MKSEPNCWSWQDQMDKKVSPWDGVRNYQASNYMKQMKIGDLAFFYHSVSEKSIVGIVKVCREYYPDYTDETGRFGMVDVAFHQTLPHPVTLAQIKADPRLVNLPLIKQSRLSVMPIDPVAWQVICQIAEQGR